MQKNTKQEAQTLTVITRAMQSKLQGIKKMEKQDEHFAYDDPQLYELEIVLRTSRKYATTLDQENMVFQDKEKARMIHDLKTNEVGE